MEKGKRSVVPRSPREEKVGMTVLAATKTVRRVPGLQEGNRTHSSQVI